MNDTNTLSAFALLRPAPTTPASGLGKPRGGLLSVRKAGGDKGGESSIIVVC